MLIRGLECEAEARGGILRTELEKPADERNVKVMIERLRELGVEHQANAEVLHLETAALAQLKVIAVPEERKVPLRVLATMLQSRTS